MISMVFLWFHYQNQLFGNFHYYICNQRLKIRGYSLFNFYGKFQIFDVDILYMNFYFGN